MVSLFLTPCNGLFAPTSVKSNVQFFFNFWNPWGKVMKRSGLRLIFFAHKGCKITCNKISFFYGFFLHLFTPFKCLFAPICQSPMCKPFRFSESLGKRDGKNWSQIGNFFAYKGFLKLQRKKVCLTSRIFWYWCHYPHRLRDVLAPVCGIF